jgi:uncharacterized protein YqgV (UPF0045/DUF77 family)
VPVPPAELTAHFTLQGPEAARAAARDAAAASGLAREAGPKEMALTGSRAEVLAALREVVEAALDAGAHQLDVRFEAPSEARP